MDANKLVDILLIEDNPNDAELTIRAFAKYKLANNIVHVHDGEQALDYLLARNEYSGRDIGNRPRIILLDLNLPKINGLDVLRFIRSTPSIKLIPVIILTTSKEESDLMRGYDLGANSYIVKPVEFDKFVEVVKELGLYWLLLNELP